MTTGSGARGRPPENDSARQLALYNCHTEPALRAAIADLGSTEERKQSQLGLISILKTVNVKSLENLLNR